MTNEFQTIEVEVVEIDGAAPVAKFRSSEKTQPQQQDWRTWQNRIRRLDSRWWPLWVILAITGVLLLVTVGVGVAAIVVIFRVLSGIVRAVFR
jgi:hypothetical protein